MSPSVDRLVDTGQTVVRNVIRQEGVKPVDVHVGVILDVVLLGGDHRQIFLLVATILAELHAPDNLLVNQIGGDLILGWLVPRREYLLSEEQSPRGVPLLSALLLGVLLALRDGIHHVVAAATKRRDFIEQRDVEGKAELVAQRYLIGQLVAQFPGRGRGISQQRFRVAVHKRDRQHNRFLRFRRLQLQPARRLVPRAVVERPLEPILAVRRVSRWPLPDERSQVIDELLGRSETADAQRQQDPAASVRRLGRIIGQLLAYLTVDLVPQFRP